MIRSNRTFMELKFKSLPSGSVFLEGSNRTFMELKLLNFFIRCVNIVSSNRTFMELKWLTLQGSIHARNVLIAPLWN